MISDLTGKIALVTGGAGGIGSGICEVLAECGARVIIGYNTSRHAAAMLATQLANQSAEHASVALQVTDSNALNALAHDIQARHHRLDILVNTHALTRTVPADDLDGLDDELIDRMLATNVRGTFATARAFKSLLAQRDDGLIVNISSIAAKLAIGSNIMYCASKAAIDTMTQSLALALAPKIRVVAVAPGLVRTEASKKFAPSLLENHISRTPLKRLTTPRDIGETIVALATHLKMVTGVIIPVDAGRSLN